MVIMLTQIYRQSNHHNLILFINNHFIYMVLLHLQLNNLNYQIPILNKETNF